MTFFKYILEQLNDNDHGVKFRGDRFFIYYPYKGDFEVYEKNAEKMKYDAINFVPATEIQNMETPFVDLNKRSDYMKTFMFPAKVENLEDFEEKNPVYLALMDFVKNNQGETVEVNDEKYTLKLYEPTKESNPLIKGKSFYVLLSLSLNTVKLSEGYTGKDTTIEIGEEDGDYHRIDFTDYSKSAGVDLEPGRRLDIEESNRHYPMGKAHQININANHRSTAIDNAIEEALDDEDYNKLFKIRITRPNGIVLEDERTIESGSVHGEYGIPDSYQVSFVKKG